MRLALFQPDIPQNAGAVLRLGACFSTPVEVIGPSGFVWDEAKMRRAGMDYRLIASVTHHDSWRAFLQGCREGRLGGDALGRPPRIVLLTTQGAVSVAEFQFRAEDVILLGRESAGVPETVHAGADARVLIPIAPEARSLNVATAAAIALAEGLRQTGGFPVRSTR